MKVLEALIYRSGERRSARVRQAVAGGALALVAMLALAAPSLAAAPHLRLRVDAPDTITAGQLAGINVAIENDGNAPTNSEFEFTDDLPSSFQNPEITTGPLSSSRPSTLSASCEVVGSILSCRIADPLSPGEQVQIGLGAQVESGTSGTVTNTTSISGGGAAPVSMQQSLRVDTPDPFSIAQFSAFLGAADGGAAAQAGEHPDLIDTSFRISTFASSFGGSFPVVASAEQVKDVAVHLPPGLIGNPQSTAIKCSADELNRDMPGRGNTPACPPESQVGIVHFFAAGVPGMVPVYNMVAPPGFPAALGFRFIQVPVILVASLRPGDHGVDILSRNISSTLPIHNAEVTIWGVPAEGKHDQERAPCLDSGANFGNSTRSTCPSNAPATAFLRMPTQCGASLPFAAEASSYQHPSLLLKGPESTLAPLGGCEAVPFSPALTVQPTTTQAASPAGLTVDLSLPQQAGPEELAEADLKSASVTLPAGMTINPSSAGGLGSCSDAQLGLGSSAPATCPDSAKLGTVEVDTPLLENPVRGSIFLRPQNSTDPTSGEMYRIALELRDDERGVEIKLAGQIRADPTSGRLTTTFDDNPQLPFSNLHLELKSGPRAPLVTPPRCGTYATTATLTSWSGQTVELNSSFTISGDAAACPGPAFKPGFAAGTTNPVAGSYSPFSLRLTRSDVEGEFAALSSLTLPPGLIGSLKGLAYCPESALQAADSAQTPAFSGADALVAAPCPSASRIGTATVGAGAGTDPFYVESGTVYLAGPYKGAPLSLAVSVPALAGPFDLGNAIVRSALFVDPTDAHLTAVSDKFPTILGGIPLQVRDIRLNVNRPNFTLNPTSCEPMQIAGTVLSNEDQRADVSARFQVGSCAALAFKPKLTLSLKGGTRRSDHPALRASLTMPAKTANANIAKAVVSLPHSEFLAQSHIRTVCTRVQFAAGAGGGSQCPKGSVYGHARAFSPLLDKPLEGPVYLRSSDNPLPDLVASLGGQIHVDLVGRIDSKHGGIRTTFATVPDAPVSKFVLTMQGGSKGLLENSRNLCAQANRATALFDGQNGKTADQRPLVRSSCGKAKKQGKHGKR